MSLKSTFTDGLMKDNPVFVLLLALCPILGVSSTLENSLGMGIIILIVLLCTGIIVSVIRKIVPSEIRIPVFITIIATIVTAAELLILAFLPALFTALGIFLPLVVSNCIIFGRAEAFAYKNKPLFAIVDACGMGAGCIIAFGAVGLFRELLGTGAIDILGLYIRFFPNQFAVPFFVTPGGAFVALGIIVGLVFTVRIANQERKMQKAKVLKAKGGTK